MTDTHMTTIDDAPARRPRIALMGEFSAGKSTLSNLLLGAKPLPEKVTATRLSPVWISQGSKPAYREDMNGELWPVSLETLQDVPVEETRVIRLFMDADILEVCDLIDFPGISDPNMSSEVWQRMLSHVDAVLWCTHATQAWRQSEAAVWEDMPEAVREHSALLITRFDKLLTEKDRLRVIKRLERETAGMFGAMFPISLTQALEAGEDFDKWKASGADAFAEHLIKLVNKLAPAVMDSTESLYSQAIPAADMLDDDEVQTTADQVDDLMEVAPEAPTRLNVPIDLDAEPELPPGPRLVSDAAPEPETRREAARIEPLDDAPEAYDDAEAESSTGSILPRRIKAQNVRTPRPGRPRSADNEIAQALTQDAGPTRLPEAKDLRGLFNDDDQFEMVDEAGKKAARS